MSMTIIYIYEYNYRLNRSKSRGYILALTDFFNQRIYFDQLLNNLIIRNVLHFSGRLNNYIDNGLLKVFGSTGVNRLLNNIQITPVETYT